MSERSVAPALQMNAFAPASGIRACTSRRKELGRRPRCKPLSLGPRHGAAQGLVVHGMVARRVLVVDDDAETLDEVASYLRAHGFRCETALDGHEALKKIVETPDIAILITDIRMPGIDGLEMVVYLQEHLPCARELDVIIITGHAGPYEVSQARKIRVFDFLTKPISLSELLHSVQRADSERGDRR